MRALTVFERRGAKNSPVAMETPDMVRCYGYLTSEYIQSSSALESNSHRYITTSMPRTKQTARMSTGAYRKNHHTNPWARRDQPIRAALERFELELEEYRNTLAIPSSFSVRIQVHNEDDGEDSLIMWADGVRVESQVSESFKKTQ